MLLAVGTLFLLGGLSMFSFWTVYGVPGSMGHSGLREMEFLFAAAMMLAFTALGLVTPGILLIVTGLKLKKR